MQVELGRNLRPLWLLLSDIHFRSQDLERIVRTADWINSIPSTYNISRAIVCGDLLTARTSQPTHVLTACYRFLNKLMGGVPHVNIIPGNHDFAYRQDYTTSALEPMSIDRLAPFVTFHTEIASHVWDGRRVFVMPFREDQEQIVRSIHDLDPKSASTTVGFGHLAINRAITQKYVFSPETGISSFPSRYPGLTSAGGFAPLARTFTGHFHSHQTIFQAASQESKDPQGSITYIGAPLQLTWADLFDERRGVVLLDPETLESELVSNPYAVGYITVEVQDVLTDEVRADKVQDKHVMVTGKLSRHRYLSARNRLVKLGARSVRDWAPFEPQWYSPQKGLGKTMLNVDAESLPKKAQEKVWEETEKTRAPITAEPLESAPPAGEIEREPIDLGKIIQEYVSSLELGSPLKDKRDILTVVGQRLVSIGSHVHDNTESTVKYKDIIDLSTSASLIPSDNDPDSALTRNIFAAHPVAIEITNFLGVQGTLNLEFKHHFQPGLNFIVGPNGSGKSTIIEAMVWCQFGHCIREGLLVNDVVNDVIGKNCNVRLTFANGYTISRFRKHKTFQNNVFVEKNGVSLPQFEGPSKSTQAIINELLGIDFDTFIRTILLGSESTRGFLSASRLQKRQLIETALGLGILDKCTDICNSMLGQVDEELAVNNSRLNERTHTIEHLQSQVGQMEETLTRLRDEAASIANRLQREEKKHTLLMQKKELVRHELLGNLKNEESLPDMEPGILDLQKELSRAQSEVGRLGTLAKLAQARLSIDREGAVIKQDIMVTRARIYHVEEELQRLLEENNTLEVPTPPAKNDEDNVSKETSGWGGFLLSITLVLRKFWASVRDIIDPRAHEKSIIAEKAALKVAETRQRWQDHIEAIATLASTVNEPQDKIVAMTRRVANLLHDVAYQNSMSQNDVHTALRTLTIHNASNVPSQLTSAIDEMKALTKRHNHQQREFEKEKQRRLREQHDLENCEKEIDSARRNWEVSLDRYRIMRTGKEQEIATYREHLETNAEALVNFRREVADLSKEAESIDSHREIFAFWQSALTRRQVAAPRTTFRQHVTACHLRELDKLFGQILMVMYQDAHYAHSMSTGAIGALFKEEDEDDSSNSNSNTNTEDDDGSKIKRRKKRTKKDKNDDSGEATATSSSSSSSSSSLLSVLDSTLTMSPALEYAKKSGGERKRVDLALFFALFVTGEARSAHAAGYMLVDEAFDSLDAAGQASVLRWCRWMTGRLAYVFVITHSRILVELADKGEGEGGATAAAAAADEDGVGVNVVTVRAGSKGTEVVPSRDHDL